MAHFKWVSLIITLILFTHTSSITTSKLTQQELEQIPLNFLKLAKRPSDVDYMVGIRRAIHENPELGYEEFETSELIRAELDKLGISYKHPIAVTGIVGYVGTGKGPFVALRADMDALAMEEKVEWEHKSKVPGKIHGCGHDAHVAMLLSAAKLLQEHRHNLQGTVVLVFQPAEEGGGGAREMLKYGILENVEAIFGIHVSARFPIGSVASKAGPLYAGNGFFEAVINGKGGHAALPHHSIDPILAASNVIVSLQHLVSREADPLDSQVITQQASVYRCNATVTFFEKSLYPATINNKELHQYFKKIATEMIGLENVIEMQPSMGAEDFSFFAEAVPGFFFSLGMKNETRGILHSSHSPYFTVNEDALPYGAAFHAALATRYLLENQPKTCSSKGSSHDEL